MVSKINSDNTWLESHSIVITSLKFKDAWRAVTQSQLKTAEEIMGVLCCSQWFCPQGPSNRDNSSSINNF